MHLQNVIPKASGVTEKMPVFWNEMKKNSYVYKKRNSWLAQFSR